MSDIIVIVLGAVLMITGLRSNPKNWVLAGLGIFGIAFVVFVEFLHIEIPTTSALWFLTGAAFVAALITRKSNWIAAFLLFAGALTWLGFDKSTWVFCFAVVAAIAAFLEGRNRMPIWAFVSATSAAVAVLITVST